MSKVIDPKIRLARNATLGDGCFWKHPECCNYKLVFTGTNRSWLTYKGGLLGRTPSVCREANSTKRGVFPNAKTLYHFATFVDPVYTSYKVRSRLDILAECDLVDLAMWFLDDGCTVERRGMKHRDDIMRYRYILCIGGLCPSEAEENTTLSALSVICADFHKGRMGSIQKNNSKATCNNKVWEMPVNIAREVVKTAQTFGVSGFDNKLRYALA